MTTRYNGQNPESSPQSTGSKLRARLAEIEARMEGLTSQIALLRVEKEEILGNLESVTYPVLTLPPEIVSEIFLHYVGSSPLRGKQDPLRLASVCTVWRAIAISTHALWTYFCYTHPLHVDSVANLLRCWLPRVGCLSMDLTVRLPGGESASTAREEILRF
jgi:hypothetical protein